MEASTSSKDSPNSDQPPPKLTIQDLPNEMLLQILKWISTERDLQSVQQVCPLWHVVIDECIGREVSWTSSGLIIYPNTTSVDPLQRSVSSLGIRHLQVCLSSTPSTFPSLKFPHLLKSLILFWAPHPDIFTNLVKNAVNISKFIVSSEALLLINSQLLEHHLHLPNLRDLELGKEVSRKIDATHCLSPRNLRLLLKHNHFPLLSHLSIRFRLASVYDLETVQLLLKFIQVHSLPLRGLNMTLNSPEQLRPSDQGTFRQSLENIFDELKGHPNPSCSLKVLNLHAKNMFLCPGRSNSQLDALKMILIWPLGSLQELYLDLRLISNELIQAICSRNGSTLKNLTIKQNSTNPVEILDLSVLSSLQSLQKLALHGHQEFTGALELPSTLECLNLEGALKGDDIEHILLRLPRLHEVALKIKCIPQEGYDIRLETLQQFVKNRRVHKCRIFLHSFSCPDGVYVVRPKDLAEKGIFNGDPEHPITLNCKGYVFQVELNKAGYYTHGQGR